MQNRHFHGMISGNGSSPNLEDLLDSCIILSSAVDSNISRLTRKYHVGVHGQITFKGAGIVMHGFFRKNQAPDPDEVTFIQLSNSRDLGSVYAVDILIEDPDVTEFLKSACDIPSTVVFHPRMLEGRFEVTLLFNHTVTQSVSELITRFSEKGGNASIKRMGKPDGFMRMLVEISHEIPLAFLEISMKMPEGKGITEEQKSMGENWLRVIKYNAPSGNQKFVYLCPDEVQEDAGGKITRISEELPLYETEENDPFLMQLETEISKLSISRLGGARLKKGGNDIIGVIMVPAFIGRYIQCLHSFRQKNPGFKFTILQIHGIGASS